MTEQILAVQKMQDYIETHLTEDITLFPYDTGRSHRLFRYDGRRLADQHLGRIQAPYQDAAGGNDGLWIAGNPHGSGKQLLCVPCSDGRLRSCADHGADSIYHAFAGKQHSGNGGADLWLVRRGLFQLPAHRYGGIWPVGRQNIHAIADGAIRYSADHNGDYNVCGQILLSSWQ